MQYELRCSMVQYDQVWCDEACRPIRWHMAGGQAHRSPYAARLSVRGRGPRLGACLCLPALACACLYAREMAAKPEAIEAWPECRTGCVSCCKLASGWLVRINAMSRSGTCTGHTAGLLSCVVQAMLAGALLVPVRFVRCRVGRCPEAGDTAGTVRSVRSDTVWYGTVRLIVLIAVICSDW